MDGRGGSQDYGQNENLTLTDAELAATGKRPQATKGGEALRYRCPVHGGDNQNSLELTVKTGRFFCHKCRCWGYMDWAREKFARERGFDRDDGRDAGHSPTPRRHVTKSPPPPPPPPPPTPHPTVEPVRDDLEALLAGYQEALPGSWGEKYLEYRGVSLDLAREYGVGYASPKEWPGRGWKGGRLVFPHHRPDGVLVSFYGRAVAKGEVPKQSKHDHLRGNKGWFNARAVLEGEGPLYVCEAALDALALMAAGYERTLAIFGTYGWRQHWIPSNVREIVIAADADEGGNEVREHIGVGAKLLGVRVSYLTAESYGGEKDAAAAYALGKLTLGETPGGGAVPDEDDEGGKNADVPARDYRAEVLAGLEAARRNLARDDDLDVSPATYPLPEDAASTVGRSPARPTDASTDASTDTLTDAPAEPEPDNVVDIREGALRMREKRIRDRDGGEG